MSHNDTVPIANNGDDKPLESTGGDLIFNWDSALHNEDIQAYQENTRKQLVNVSQYIDENNPKNYTDSGKLIVNLTDANDWYRNNVAFIFSTGKIFNAIDRQRLDTLLGYFREVPNQAFLSNLYYVYDYNNVKVKDIEQSMGVGNGNYHIMLIPIVLADENGQLPASCPDDLYGNVGIVDKYCDWFDVESFMKAAISKYGIVTETIPSNDSKPSWLAGVDGMSAPTERGLKEGEQFNYNNEVNADGELVAMRDEFLDFRRSQTENYGIRNRNTGRGRTKGDNPHADRITKNGSLLKRIYEESKTGTYVEHNDHIKGVQLRLNERNMPPQKVQPEFQIYDIDDTYIDGFNNPYNDPSSRSADIPYFGQMQTNRSRTVTNTPELVIKRQHQQTTLKPPIRTYRR